MKKIIAAVLSVFLVFGGSFSTQAAVTSTELQSYLQEVALTEEELNAYLTSFDLTLEDFEDAADLRDTLGPRVTPETLEELLADYEMTREELKALLVEYGELEEGQAIEDSFLFIYDIEDIISMDEGFEDIDLEDMIAEMAPAFAEFGITEAEFATFMEHIAQVIEQDPTVLDQLDALSDRMINFADFETIDELSAAQINELLSITDGIKNALQLDFSFYLVKDGKKTPVSFQSLLSLEDLQGASLLVEVYNKAGKFLLDFILTGEMIGSDMLEEVGGVIEKAPGKVVEKPVAKVDRPTTQKGAKLPNTAGDYMGTLLFGLALMAIAVFAFRKAGAAK
ncbi:MAG: processed acidic surface protein [Bacillus sp. (in: firmicutes)]